MRESSSSLIVLVQYLDGLSTCRGKNGRVLWRLDGLGRMTAGKSAQNRLVNIADLGADSPQAEDLLIEVANKEWRGGGCRCCPPGKASKGLAEW